MLNEDGQNSEN